MRKVGITEQQQEKHIHAHPTDKHSGNSDCSSFHIFTILCPSSTCVRLWDEEQLKDTSLDGWNTSSVMFPELTLCFGSFKIIHPHSEDPARAGHTPACAPATLAHRLFLMIQSHLEAVSAAYLVDLMAFFLAAPVMPSRVKTSTSHCNRLTSSLIASQPAVLHQLLVLGRI